MSKLALFGTVAILLLSSGSAGAFSLTNRDDMNQELLVLEYEGETNELETVVIAPDETVDDLCEAGCTITDGHGDEISFKGHESVVIEDGSLVIEE